MGEEVAAITDRTGEHDGGAAANANGNAPESPVGAGSGAATFTSPIDAFGEVGSDSKPAVKASVAAKLGCMATIAVEIGAADGFMMVLCSCGARDSGPQPSAVLWAAVEIISDGDIVEYCLVVVGMRAVVFSDSSRRNVGSESVLPDGTDSDGSVHIICAP